MKVLAWYINLNGIENRIPSNTYHTGIEKSEILIIDT
jgi:hypothetical protein